MISNTLKTEIELLESLQELHQNQERIRLKWLPPLSNDFARHILNLTRIKLEDNPLNADITAGSLQQLLELKQSKGILMMTDENPPNSKNLVELLLRGYRIEGGRLLFPILKELPEKNRLSIMVITNLYPPQELGGYGRSIYDYVSNLKLLGHNLQVLTSHAPYLGGDLSKEERVSRKLKLLGSYEGGVQEITDSRQRKEIQKFNHLVIEKELETFQPEVVLLGNLDLLDNYLIHQIVGRDIPCWHHIGFSQSSFSTNELPKPGQPYYPLATVIIHLVRSINN